jgi:hypothetical protein
MGGGGVCPCSRVNASPVPVGLPQTVCVFARVPGVRGCLGTMQMRGVQRDLADTQRELFLERQTVNRQQVWAGEQCVLCVLCVVCCV